MPSLAVMQKTLSAVGAFNPRKLLGTGKLDGAWHDPSDLSTMFQDSAGTTPVTGVEQPVGLHLDKSGGLQLGPDVSASLVPANWSVAGEDGTHIVTWIGGGGFRYQSDTTTPALSVVRAAALTAGKFYKMVVTVTSYIGGSLKTDSFGDSRTIATGVGVFTTYGRASSTSLSLLRATTNVDITVASVSVKELPGYHATQSITASRPTLSARYNLLLNSATLSAQNVTTVAAQYTLSFTGTGTVTLSGTATGSLVGTGVSDRVSLAFTSTAGTLTLTVTGSVTLAMLNLGASAMTYQAITTATSYDSNPALFPYFLRYDGIDDYMNLPYMGLYASGAASVVMGVKSSIAAAARQFVVEGNSLNNTPIYTLVRSSTGTELNTRIRDDAGLIVSTTDIPSVFGDGVVKIVAMLDTGSSINPFVNSSVKSISPYTRSTTTLNNTTVGAYVSLAGVANYTEMSCYGSIIVKGAALTDKQRKLCEQYLARKTGVALQ